MIFAVPSRRPFPGFIGAQSFSLCPPFLKFIFFSLSVCALLILAGCQSQQMPHYFVPQAGVDYSRGMLHKVESGDTLEIIATYYQRDPNLLAYLNDLVPPNELKVGDYIFIPPDNTDSVVSSGKVTLDSIRKVRHEMMLADANGSAVPQTSTSKRSGKDRYYTAPRPIPHSSITSDDGPAPPLGDYGFNWPLSGRYVRGFSCSGWRKYHLGVDIAAPQGTSIGATQNGTVLFSGKTRDIPAYGNLVAIDHGNGFTSIYAHCSETLARPGQRVSQGEIIARVGATGNATGNHLHLELRYKGRVVNPEKYLPIIKKSGTQIAGGTE